MGNNVHPLFMRDLSPEIVLRNMLDSVDLYQEIYVVAKRKDGGFSPWASGELKHLPDASLVLQDLAFKYIRGEIDGETK